MPARQHRTTVKRILVEFSDGDADFVVEAHDGPGSFVDEFDCTTRGDFVVDAHGGTSLTRLNFVGKLTGGARVLRVPSRRVTKRKTRRK